MKTKATKRASGDRSNAKRRDREPSLVQGCASAEEEAPQSQALASGNAASAAPLEPPDAPGSGQISSISAQSNGTTAAEQKTTYADGPTVWREPQTPDDFLRQETAENIAHFMGRALDMAGTDPHRFGEDYVSPLCSFADILVGDSGGYLCELAKRNNPAAIKQLALVAIRATECLEQLTENHAALLRPLAATARKWPVMTSKRPCDNKGIPDILKVVGLGGPKDGSKLRWDSPINVCTEELRRHFQLVHGFIDSLAKEVKDGPVQFVIEESEARPGGFPVYTLETYLRSLSTVVPEKEIAVVLKSAKYLRDWRQKQPPPKSEFAYKPDPKTTPDFKHYLEGWAAIFRQCVQVRYGSLEEFWQKALGRNLPEDRTRLRGKVKEDFEQALESLGPPIDFPLN